MRIVTACALIDSMDAMEIWRFWTARTKPSEHAANCTVYYGYPYECECKVPANWCFPYDVRYTWDVQRTGNFKNGSPPQVRTPVKEWWHEDSP